MDYTVTLLMSGFVTHDVKRFVVSRPEGFSFTPGQAVELTIDAPEWRDQSRPFSPTSLPDDQVLEFTIKGYRDHHGVTEQLHQLKPGARLRITDAFGTIMYKGPGMFIAGGAGITPFIAILRWLAASGQLAGHSLLFSNKTPVDIINEAEFAHHLDNNFIRVCTQAGDQHCPQGRIDKDFLKARAGNFDQHFYTCGPPAFVRAINGSLTELGAQPDALVFER